MGSQPFNHTLIFIDDRSHDEAADEFRCPQKLSDDLQRNKFNLIGRNFNMQQDDTKHMPKGLQQERKVEGFRLEESISRS